MGKIMKNGRSYTYASAPTTTRFVSDPNNENYGWIQYKDENGEWVNYEQAIRSGVLFSANNNAAEFVATEEYSSFYYTDPSILTVGETLVLKPDDSKTMETSHAFVMMSKKIDVTDYSKIVMKHTTILPQAGNANWAGIFVTDALTAKVPTRLTPLAQIYYMSTDIPKQSSSEPVELDISSISGTVYIFVELRPNFTGVTSANCSCEITEMYME